jgi:proteic killer suppression protein
MLRSSAPRPCIVKHLLTNCKHLCYGLPMIEASSVKHRELKQFIETGRTSGIPQRLVKRVINRLAVLDAMRAITDLPSSCRAHKLSGDRRGTWSIWVSGPWRLTFRFSRETVSNLNLEQYH